MNVALDAMGGDTAPAAPVSGALRALARHPTLEVTLVGDEPRLQELVRAAAPPPAAAARLRYHHAPGVVPMEASPVEALRRTPDASIAAAVGLVREGRCQALVTAGNTGAAVAATHQALGRLPGIRRPGIAALFPTVAERPVVVIDVGATVKCLPVHLCQFGIMGHAFARTVLGVPEPRVGLLNIGEEDAKGNELVRRTRELCRAAAFPFVGNVEGQDLFRGKCEVVICEGFVGNVVLKVTEGLAEILTRFVARLLAEEGVRGGEAVLRRLKGLTDFSTYGGAVLLGVNGLCIIGHGRSGPEALANALLLGARYAEAALTRRIRESLVAGQLRLRARPAS